MKPISTAGVLAVLFLSLGCHRNHSVAADPLQNRACLVTIAAGSGNDNDIAELQEDLRLSVRPNPFRGPVRYHSQGLRSV
jgi:hypothetical protein